MALHFRAKQNIRRIRDSIFSPPDGHSLIPQSLRNSTASFPRPHWPFLRLENRRNSLFLATMRSSRREGALKARYQFIIFRSVIFLLAQLLLQSSLDLPVARRGCLRLVPFISFPRSSVGKCRPSQGRNTSLALGPRDGVMVGDHPWTQRCTQPPESFCLLYHPSSVGGLQPVINRAAGKDRHIRTQTSSSLPIQLDTIY